MLVSIMGKPVKLKKLLFALAAAGILFGLLETALYVVDYQGAPALARQLEDIRFSVAGELYGEFDPHRFWRLPNVAPRFTQKQTKILCMADSVTVMYEGRGYPELLGESLIQAGYERPVEVFNAGVPEYTTWQGRVYLERELIGTKPDLVTVQFGWNDHWEARLGVPDHRVRFPDEAARNRLLSLSSWRTYRLARSMVLSRRFSLRVPLDHYRENLAAMAELVKKQQGRVIFISPVYLEKNQGWLAMHRQYMEATRQTAKEQGCLYLDLQEQFAHDPSLFLEPEQDQVHFNWKGAQIIADAIARKAVEEKLLP